MISSDILRIELLNSTHAQLNGYTLSNVSITFSRFSCFIHKVFAIFVVRFFSILCSVFKKTFSINLFVPYSLLLMKIFFLEISPKE